MSRSSRRAELAGARTIVCPVSDDDIPAIQSWYPEAIAAVQGVRDPGAADFGKDLSALRMSGQGGETLVIARADDPEPIGLLQYRLPEAGWLEFRFLALANGHRGRGYGSEAVQLIEHSGLAQRFAAFVHAANGLAFYFWLRMGYRPAVSGELTWREHDPGDMISMVRGDSDTSR